MQHDHANPTAEADPSPAPSGHLTGEEADEGWELVDAAVVGDAPPKIVTSRAGETETDKGGECQDFQDFQASKTRDSGENAGNAAGDAEDVVAYSSLLSTSEPTFIATVLVAAFAALFLLTSMFMAVAMFSWAVGSPPARQSGALTFYHAETVMQRYHRREKATGSQLRYTMNTHRLLQNRVKMRNESTGKRLRRINLGPHPPMIAPAWYHNASIARASIARNAKPLFDKAVANPFLPRLCPPRRICLPPPTPLLEVATTTTFLTKIHETSNSYVKTICDGCMEVDQVPSSKSKALALRKLGLLANLSLLNSSQFKKFTLPGFKKGRLKLESKETTLWWRRLLQKRREVRIHPERRGASRNHTCQDRIPTSSPGFHGRTKVKVKSLQVKYYASSLKNMSLMVTTMDDPPRVTPALFSYVVRSTPQTVQKAVAKTGLRLGTFNVNAVLGVQRLSFLQPTVTPRRAPKLVVTSLMNDAPAAFPLVLRNVYAWSSRAESVAPKICNMPDLSVHPKFAILNGTF